MIAKFMREQKVGPELGLAVFQNLVVNMWLVLRRVAPDRQVDDAIVSDMHRFYERVGKLLTTKDANEMDELIAAMSDFK